MPVKIYLVRHGEAAAAWGDDPDPGLSEAGRTQAEAAASALTPLGARMVLTSPLRRCRETAAAFERASGLCARVEPFVAEIPTPDDVSDRKTWLRELMAGAWPSGAHPHALLLARFRERFLWTLQALPEDAIVFTHFVAINVALGAALVSDRVLVRQPANCAIVSFESTGGRLRLIEGGAEGASAIL
jgi:broad specificity phosphatase PhoE